MHACVHAYIYIYGIGTIYLLLGEGLFQMSMESRRPFELK